MTQIDWLEDLLGDQERQQHPDDEQVETLEMLAVRYDEMTNDIKEMESYLAKQKRDLFALVHDTIPDKMMELGVKKIVLTDGTELSYKPFYKGTVLRDEGLDWLEKAGYPDAVKQTLTLEVSRTDNGILDTIKRFCDAEAFENLSMKEKASIHHMTLASLIKSLTQQGKELPKELFEVYIGNIATLRKGKNDE